jgi:CheY-like chemotaxis protein
MPRPSGWRGHLDMPMPQLLSFPYADLPVEPPIEQHPGPTVLIVEDNEDNLAIYSAILTYGGFQVIEALDGEAGVAAAHAHLPAAILMDVALPAMDGWEATRLLKAAPDTADIPIIALTAHALDEHRQRSIEAGCDVYLAKPVEPRVVLDVVRQVLAARSAR